MCDWRDIKDHADDARKAGWLVQEVVFEGSAHCAHFPRDPEKYTSAVEGIRNGLEGGVVSTVRCSTQLKL
jgi:Eukaryotic protein of unknown function (DUF829)